MKFVLEWIVVGFVFTLGFWPYVSYYRTERTFKGSLYENGAGYMELFLRCAKYHFKAFFVSLVMIVLLSAWSVVIALAFSAYFLMLAATMTVASIQGYRTS